MTATPLYNGPRVSCLSSCLTGSDVSLQDLVSLALGLGAVRKEKMNAIEKFYATALRRAKGVDKKAVSKEATRLAAEGLMGAPVENGRLLSAKMTHNQMEVKSELVVALREAVGDIVIRRRPTSKNLEGENLFGLPPLTEIDFPVHPTTEEAELYELMRKEAAQKL